MSSTSTRPAPVLTLEDGAGAPSLSIRGYDRMPPFLMSLASDSDLWLFLSSTGALTAGRKDPDHALFPYTTDDRIHDSAGQAGPVTLVRVQGKGVTLPWEPFSDRREGAFQVERILRKSATCDRVEFIERNEDLRLEFSHSWTTSAAHGFVREAKLVNRGEDPVSVEILDGLLNIMPADLTRRFQMEYSTLADGYRECELIRPKGAAPLALFRLSSIPADRAEPNEALRANTVWARGLDGAAVLLLDGAIAAFRRAEPFPEDPRPRGRRGAFLLRTTLELAAGGERRWTMVADIGADAARVRHLKARLADGGAELAREVEDGVRQSARGLRAIVGSVDGFQATADTARCHRHWANALSNSMRGGLPAEGYLVRREDFRGYLALASRPVLSRSAAFLDTLPEVLPRLALVERARASGEADLERLAREYLPLTFSRRHGDPSRPWNIFSIQTKDESGRRLLGYQGNWRDIFQNWEALALSYPGWLDAMIFKFLDSSTADGWNPYRVTMTGFDWEVVDPHDDWSFIGYWGDHQAAYLLRLLESSERRRPGALARELDLPLFVYARVPYRIRDYRDMLKDPKSTVDFDATLHKLVVERARSMGTEGMLCHDHEGRPERATLAEKLLVTILARLSNLVPGAGIWLNTQRPEWNDANNALVGHGVSVVTLCHLRKLLTLARGLFEGNPAKTHGLHCEVSRHALAVSAALAGDPGRDASDGAARRAVMDSLGLAASSYRANLYEKGFCGRKDSLSTAEIVELLDRALAHVNAGIRANRRDDGLYHSYNLISWSKGPVDLRRLPLMLEGQVAILASGILAAGEAADLLDAMRASALWREDQGSYLLYPDRLLPGFLERNNIPPGAASGLALLQALAGRGDRSLVARDHEGGLHFSPELHNRRQVQAALDALARGGAGDEVAALARREAEAVLDLYEETFDHHSFPGRSGSFYKYEGLGSIYWHMVSKLLLAVGEAIEEFRGGAAGAEVAGHGAIPRLMASYREIREGIGVHKPPALYGAFPTDPYSHTPSFAGAQQPGLTGQVKEDLISRLGELGLSVRAGRVSFQPSFAAAEETLAAASSLEWIDLEGGEASIPLEAGQYAFTFCQVPVVVHVGGPRDAGKLGLRVTLADGAIRAIDGPELDEALSSSVFAREGKVRRLDVFFPEPVLSASGTVNG